MDRLDKTVAKQMNLSRSGARQLIRSGAVEVNDKKIFAADEQIDINSDELKISGKIVTVRRYLYIMLNKPSGVLSAAKDPDCPTVVDLLLPELSRRGLFPAGRLDKDTTGLLIITDDGLPARLRKISDEPPTVRVQIREGKYHQVKRMFASVENSVVALRRTAIGALKLDSTLGESEARLLTDDERKMIFSEAEII